MPLGRFAALQPPASDLAFTVITALDGQDGVHGRIVRSALECHGVPPLAALERVMVVDANLEVFDRIAREKYMRGNWKREQSRPAIRSASSTSRRRTSPARLSHIAS